jgi:dihydrofolate reductase
MILISAMSRDRVIGSGTGMPWNVPAEYRQFLDLIRGQTVIMGRRSYEIFGKDLTSAHTIVVSRSAETPAGTTLCSSIETAVSTAKSFGKTVFSAGGAAIYEQTLPLADRMFISYIDGEYSGDTYFPQWDETQWREEERAQHPGFEFVAYRRHA